MEFCAIKMRSRSQHHGQRTAQLKAGSTLDLPEEAPKKQDGGGGERGLREDEIRWRQKIVLFSPSSLKNPNGR